MEQRLEWLEAMHSIQKLIADLARAFDAGPSAELLAPLFARDAVFLLDQYGTLSGRDEIANGVAANAGRGFSWTLHYLVSPTIELRQGESRALANFMLWEVAKSASGRSYMIGGRYLAEIVRSEDRWVFQNLELQADLISHYPTGWREKPAILDQA